MIQVHGHPKSLMCRTRRPEGHFMQKRKFRSKFETLFVTALAE